MKKLVLVLTIIAVVGTIFSSVLGESYKPPTFTQALKIIADSGISYEGCIQTIRDMQEYAQRADTFTPIGKLDDNDSEDEKGFLKQILGVLVDFFNNVLDFFVMIGYTIKMVVVFVLDTIKTSVSVLDVLFKLVGLSPI